MKTNVRSKISYFIVSFLFLLIIASFLFSNFDNFSMSGSSGVATVDGTPISKREFQSALQRQIEFFSQMMGGKTLTEQQIEQFGVKQSVISGLVQQKLMINEAKKLGIQLSEDELKAEIKNLPYFKKNDRFDVQLYQNLLLSNGYTPQQFEDLIKADLKQKKMEVIFQESLVDEQLAEDIINFKQKSLKVSALKVSRQSLMPLIEVSNSEILEFVSKDENQTILKSNYDENFSKYFSEAQVKARHILIKEEQGVDALKIAQEIKQGLTPANFSKTATAKTQDPGGKSNGGDLGWFGKGKMVPEFEEVAFKLKKNTISDPVKSPFGYHLIFVENIKAEQTTPLEKVKNEIAKEILQKKKIKDLDSLMQARTEVYKKWLLEKNKSRLEDEKKKIDFEFYSEATLNIFDQKIEQLNLAGPDIDKVFKAQIGEIVDLGNPGTIYLVKIESQGSTNVDKQKTQVAEEVATQKTNWQRKLREEYLKHLNQKAKIVTNQNLL